MHRKDGNVWCDDLYNKLLNPNNITEIMNAFRMKKDLGMIGPSGHIVSMETYWGQNKKTVLNLAEGMGVSVNDVLEQPFVAGSMFYARLSSLRPLFKLGLKESNFEEEAGQIDGTLAHAIERLFSICLIVENKELLSADFSTASDATLIKLYEFTNEKNKR